MGSLIVPFCRDPTQHCGIFVGSVGSSAAFGFVFFDWRLVWCFSFDVVFFSVWVVFVVGVCGFVGLAKLVSRLGLFLLLDVCFRFGVLLVLFVFGVGFGFWFCV